MRELLIFPEREKKFFILKIKMRTLLSVFVSTNLLRATAVQYFWYDLYAHFQPNLQAKVD